MEFEEPATDIRKLEAPFWSRLNFILIPRMLEAPIWRMLNFILIPKLYHT